MERARGEGSEIQTPDLIWDLNWEKCYMFQLKLYLFFNTNSHLHFSYQNTHFMDVSHGLIQELLLFASKEAWKKRVVLLGVNQTLVWSVK